MHGTTLRRVSHARREALTGIRALGDLRWRKARKSASGGCVEVAPAPAGMVAVRDSKDPGGPVLLYTPVEWDAFLDGVKRGEFDDLIEPQIGRGRSSIDLEPN
jgi:hypothetical protein